VQRRKTGSLAISAPLPTTLSPPTASLLPHPLPPPLVVVRILEEERDGEGAEAVLLAEWLAGRLTGGVVRK